MANETTTIIAKLVKAHSFARGDFRVASAVGAGVVLHDLRFANSNTGDKGNIPPEGTLYQISGYPVNAGQDQTLADIPSVKKQMIVVQIPTPEEEVAVVQKLPPKPLSVMLMELGDVLTGGQSYTPGAMPPSCSKAPVRLKDAIKKNKVVDASSQRSLPKTGKITQDKTTGENVYEGLYVEHGSKGDFAVTAGGKGLIVDKEGNIYQEGKVVERYPSTVRPHAAAGIPTTANPVEDVNPRNVMAPSISRLPDLSLLNWTIKIFMIFDTVSDLFDIKFNPENISQSGINLKPEFESAYKADQEAQGLKGKIS